MVHIIKIPRSIRDKPAFISLKDFRISRTFFWTFFIENLICGIILPIVLIIQHLRFILYYTIKFTKLLITEDTYEAIGEDSRVAIAYDYLRAVWFLEFVSKNNFCQMNF